jgi:hypothetical protein
MKPAATALALLLTALAPQGPSFAARNPAALAGASAAHGAAAALVVRPVPRVAKPAARRSLVHLIGSGLKRGAIRVRDAVVDFSGRVVGYLELIDLHRVGLPPIRYRVNAYQDQVSAILTRGSRLGRTGFADLARRGFRAVISLTAERSDSAAQVNRVGMHYLSVPIIDNTAPTRVEMLDFLAFLRRPEHQPAYVHCEAGKGRTGVAVAIYRIAMEGWTPEAALAEAERFGLRIPAQRNFILHGLGRELYEGRVPGYPVAL